MARSQLSGPNGDCPTTKGKGPMVLHRKRTNAPGSGSDSSSVSSSYSHRDDEIIEHNHKGSHDETQLMRRATEEVVLRQSDEVVEHLGSKHHQIVPQNVFAMDDDECNDHFGRPANRFIEPDKDRSFFSGGGIAGATSSFFSSATSYFVSWGTRSRKS